MKYIFLTVLVIVAACQSKDQPDDLIDSKKMVKVMTEIHLLEAKIKHISIVPHDSSIKVYNHYEKLLFEDLGITQDQYERSFNYYVDNPTEFEKIYNTVVDTLMQREKIYK